MSRDAVEAAADTRAFAPTARPGAMSARHVPFDDVLMSDRFETRVSAHLLRGGTVFLVGPTGAGKTSLTSWVSEELPDVSVAVRLLISTLADPTDVGEVMKLALGTLLDVIALDADQREEIHIERAETRTASRAPTGISGGRFGGGLIPGHINVSLGSLRQEFVESKLNGEYVAALGRVIANLTDSGIRLIFVLDDAEAIVGGPDRPAVVEGLVGGAVRLLVEEIDAGLLFAVQPHIVEDSDAYSRLAPSTLELELPRLGDHAHGALTSILDRCLRVSQLEYDITDVFASDALTGLVQFYDDVHGDLRKTLSAANYAVEDAASVASMHVTAAHVRVGAAQAA